MIGFILLYAAWAVIPITLLILYRGRPPWFVILGFILSAVLWRSYWSLPVALSGVTLAATLVYAIVDIRRASRFKA